ncbi:MAG: hypothetical protein QXR30_02905 [Candidatus Woesearchaeota archaeon]
MDENEMLKTLVGISKLYNDTNNKLYEYNEFFFDRYFEHFKEYYSDFINNYKSIKNALNVMNEDYRNLMYNSVKIFSEYKNMYQSSKKYEDLKSLYNLGSLEELVFNNPLELIIVFFRDELNFQETFNDKKDINDVMNKLYSFLSDFEVLYNKILNTNRWIDSLISNGAYISRKYLDISSFFEEWLNEVYSFDKKISEKINQYNKNAESYLEDKKEYLNLWLRNYFLEKCDQYSEKFLSNKEKILKNNY